MEAKVGAFPWMNKSRTAAYCAASSDNLLTLRLLTVQNVNRPAIFFNTSRWHREKKNLTNFSVCSLKSH
jgi:hypothetical protein